MPITVEWHNNARSILLYTFSPDWTVADLEAAVNECKHHLSSIAQPVAVLLDYQQADAVPESLLGFGRRLFPVIDKRISTIVMVGASPLFRSTYLAILRSIGKITHTIDFVETVEQALALIDSRRQDDSS